MTMLIRDLMTAPAVTVTAGTPIGTALRLLDDRKITALPVVDSRGVLVGIVSEADLVPDAALLDERVPVTAVRTTADTPPRRVADVMSHLAATVNTDDDLDVAIDLMWSTMVKSLPVLDRGKVAGMISRSDVIHLLAGRDDRIRTEARDLIHEERPEWKVDVQDGIVTVTGPMDPHERTLADVLARTVRGVIAVRIH
ncbi:CBS domain-containing protein [Kribbella pittospori]|uniref:CBS domain-containing protein n=1 Tax=Kribbella pittospori TaxID=722689 RepID=A0A4R0JGU3_9ACTN|nr:CBS domain-containing protein [Kribbella pittospori]TCC44874.1 CBS domain-containing protein [Kribbella pittospori]